MRKTKEDTKIMKVRKIKTAMCAFGLGVMMLAGTVSAGKTYYSFTLKEEVVKKYFTGFIRCIYCFLGV